MTSNFNVKALKLPAALVGLALLAACRVQPATDDGSENLANQATPPPLPVVEPPMDRERLLLAVTRAASIHSAGESDTAAQRALNGRRFEVRLRFGCDGQGPGTGDYGWSIDPDGRVLRLRAVPTLSLDDGLVKAVAGDKVEAAEGFWLPRPWLLNAACPAAVEPGKPAAEPATNAAKDKAKEEDLPAAQQARPAQRVGIAHFFTADDSRTRQRMNRPFEAVKKLKEGEVVGRQGFNLILSGRLRSRGDGRVILCAGTGRNGPPDCVVSADIDRVWIEQPGSKAVMADWRI